MMQPNWWDEWFTEQFATCGNSTENEKVDAVFAALSGSGMLRSRVTEIIREHESLASQPGWCGPSLSQAIRTGVADYLNAPILT